MAKITGFFKSEGASLGKYLAMRFNMKDVKKNLSRLKDMIGEFKKLSANKKIPDEEKKKEFIRLTQELAEVIKEFFLNSYKAQKRDILIVFAIINDMYTLKQDILKWEQGRLMPSNPEDLELRKIANVLNRLIEAARTEAQALRVVIKRDAEAEKLAEAI